MNMRRFTKQIAISSVHVLIVAVTLAQVIAPSVSLAQDSASPISTGVETNAAPPPSGVVRSSQPADNGNEKSRNLAVEPVMDSLDHSVSDAVTQRRSDLPHDLSPWGMFMAADRVVKAVMIGLAFASFVTWTVLLAKAIEIACARARAKRAFNAITSSETLEDADRTLANRGGPAAFMVRSAGEEMRQSIRVLDYAGDGGVKERVVSRLARIEAQAGRRLTRGTGLLATIGATAPFVGLFGTVWGIMNSFIGISQAQTTNLAVVAPGIAEALLATALGLIAAIPAVVIYNVFARAITGYRQALADAAAGVERLISRDLDFRKVPASEKMAATAIAAE
jgi:biopolymer transport protein ExbB